MKVAIIGTGVSGLLTAYLLKQQAASPDIHLFDNTAHIGGNVDTRSVDLHDKYVSAQSVRWADMGVNDFNLTTYWRIKELLEKMGFEEGRDLLELENSTSFSTGDGNVSYYINADESHTMKQKLWDEYKRFQNEGTRHLLRDSATHYMTVEQYLEENNYSKEFGEYNLYPRINGMYFVNQTHPKDMPIKAVMDYYMLQEGFGKDKGKAKRVYLKDGMSSWINKLYEYIGVNVVQDDKLGIYASPDSVRIISPQTDETFDAVFLCCHADTALSMIQQGVTSDIKKALSAYTYNDSYAVAHTYAPVLPPDRAAWKTYNIYIHDPDEHPRPYTITYVCNRHQNDKQNPEYNRFENPEYFLSLNPHKKIPEPFILTHKGRPVTRNFRHNVLDSNVLEVQNDGTMTAIQGQNNLYFAGGWTMGAGLHEQCYYAAEGAVAALIYGSTNQHQYYTPGASADEYAPEYLRIRFSDFFDRAVN